MIHPEKMTATIDGDFVLFLIGMRLPIVCLWRARSFLDFT